MLSPHTCKISITRDEPPSDYDFEGAEARLARKFAHIAMRIVVCNYMPTGDPKRRSALVKAAKDKVETSERQKTVQGFLKIWNHWRRFYLGIENGIEIKNKSQITTIENIISLCHEKKYVLNMFVACFFRSYIHRHTRPSFTHLLSYGEETFEKYYDDVISDIDLGEYEHAASRRSIG